MATWQRIAERAEAEVARLQKGMNRIEKEIARIQKRRRVITLHIEGGVVHQVEGIPPGVEIHTVDSDIDGLDPDEIEVRDGEEVHVNIYAHDPPCR